MSGAGLPRLPPREQVDEQAPRPDCLATAATLGRSPLHAASGRRTGAPHRRHRQVDYTKAKRAAEMHGGADHIGKCSFNSASLSTGRTQFDAAAPDIRGSAIALRDLTPRL